MHLHSSDRSGCAELAEVIVLTVEGPMPIYEVTLQVDPSVAAGVETHMRREHIPGILATGCFQRIRFDRASLARFRTSYEAQSEADLERYLTEHAPRFRADFQARFSSGVTLTRETWTPLQRWE